MPRTKQQALKTTLDVEKGSAVLATSRRAVRMTKMRAARPGGPARKNPKAPKKPRTKKHGCPGGQKYNRAPTVKACVRLDSKDGMMKLGSAGQVQSGKAQRVFADEAKHKYSGSVAKGTAMYMPVEKGATREQIQQKATRRRLVNKIHAKLRAVCPSEVNLGNNSLTDPKERAKQSRQRKLQLEAVKGGFCLETYDGLRSHQITEKTHTTKKGKTVTTFEPSKADTFNTSVATKHPKKDPTSTEKKAFLALAHSH